MLPSPLKKLFLFIFLNLPVNKLLYRTIITISRLSKSFSTEKSVDTLFSDIATMDSNASSIIPLSPLESSPCPPLPVRPVSDNRKLSSSLKRSTTSKPNYLTWKPSATSSSMPRLFHAHRRSQSASFGLNQLAANSLDEVNLDKVTEKLEDIFASEVWSWGKGRRGQQGLGDMLDRLQPSPIPSLSGIGVIKVVSGARHSLAMTVAGQVYGWGENCKGQACPHCTLAVCSLPQQIMLPVGETVTDISAVDNMSFILTDIGSVYSCGSVSSDDSSTSRSTMVIKIDLSDVNEMTEERSIRKIMSTNQSFYGSVVEEMFLPLCNLKALEKLFMNKMREIVFKVLEPLCVSRKPSNRGDVSEATSEARARVMTSSHKVIEMVSQSVLASWDATKLVNCANLNLLKQTEMFAKIMEDYTRAVCDCLVVDCIKIEHNSKLSSTVMDMLQKLCHIHQTEESPDMLQFLLLDPTNQLEHYISCLKSMLQAGRNASVNDLTALANAKVCDRIEKAIGILKTSNKTIERERRSLQKTREFWDIAGTKLAVLKRPKRRSVLDSKECPIGVYQL